MFKLEYIWYVCVYIYTRRKLNFENFKFSQKTIIFHPTIKPTNNDQSWPLSRPAESG